MEVKLVVMYRLITEHIYNNHRCVLSPAITRLVLAPAPRGPLPQAGPLQAGGPESGPLHHRLQGLGLAVKVRLGYCE